MPPNPSREGPHVVEFSADGRLGAVAHGKGVALVDCGEGWAVRHNLPETDVAALSFSPRGSFLLTLARLPSARVGQPTPVPEKGNLCVWDTRSGHLLAHFLHKKSALDAWYIHTPAPQHRACSRALSPSCAPTHPPVRPPGRLSDGARTRRSPPRWSPTRSNSSSEATLYSLPSPPPAPVPPAATCPPLRCGVVQRLLPPPPPLSCVCVCVIGVPIAAAGGWCCVLTTRPPFGGVAYDDDDDCSLGPSDQAHPAGGSVQFCLCAGDPPASRGSLCSGEEGRAGPSLHLQVPRRRPARCQYHQPPAATTNHQPIARDLAHSRLTPRETSAHAHAHPRSQNPVEGADRRVGVGSQCLGAPRRGQD